MEASGLILHLQRLSTEDGPGIRTTVFLKGCPMRCAWCHNPESLLATPQLQWLDDCCIGCNTCLITCPNDCLDRGSSGVIINRERCQGCGTCARECPTGALELLGKRTTARALLPELLKDRAYYEASDGGVTLSGGEPTLHVSFVEELLLGLKKAGIHTALDTCGLCSPLTLARLWSLIDLVLFDVKLFDPAAHRRHTGQDNALVLQNLRWISTQLAEGEGGKELWVRTPLIPGATDSRENVTAIGTFLAENLDGRLSRWELCAFNNLCRDKYRRLDMSWSYQETPLISSQDLHQVHEWAQSCGVDATRVFVTGAARLEKQPTG